MTIHRYQPAPDAEPIVAAATYAVAPGQTARRPRLVHDGGRTFVLWEEADGEGMLLRMAELDGVGNDVRGPVPVTALQPQDRWSAHASDQGTALAYLRPSGDDGPPDQPGAAHLHVITIDPAGPVLSEVTPVPVTLPQGASPSIASLGGQPRSLAIAWSGLGPEGLDVTFLARLRCVDGS